MAQIANTIRAVKNTRAQIGANNYELHIPKVQFAKTEPKPVTWQGGTPEAQYADSTPAMDHVCKIDLGHDYQAADSAYNWFRAHNGEQIALSWKPDADGPYTVSATITVVAPNPGGDYGKHHQSTVSCPSTPPVDSFDDAAAPTITSIVPSTVAAAGGDDILVKGTGFASATVVLIDAVEVPFTMLSATLILVEGTPAHAAGDVDVAVTNPEGTGTEVDGLTYA
jgi:hypothetical protein